MGFDKRVWTAEELRDAGTVGVRFSYTSPDGEEGYPGELEVTVTYSLNEANELTLQKMAQLSPEAVDTIAELRKIGEELKKLSPPRGQR